MRDEQRPGEPPQCVCVPLPGTKHCCWFHRVPVPAVPAVAGHRLRASPVLLPARAPSSLTEKEGTSPLQGTVTLGTEGLNLRVQIGSGSLGCVWGALCRMWVA